MTDAIRVMHVLHAFLKKFLLQVFNFNGTVTSGFMFNGRASQRVFNYISLKQCYKLGFTIVKCCKTGFISIK